MSYFWAMCKRLCDGCSLANTRLDNQPLCLVCGRKPRWGGMGGPLHYSAADKILAMVVCVDGRWSVNAGDDSVRAFRWRWLAKWYAEAAVRAAQYKAVG